MMTNGNTNLDDVDTKKSKSYPTIGELNDSLDWSDTDESLAKYSARFKRKVERNGETYDEAGFRERFRLVLLEEAFDGRKEQKADARLCLHMAGVWEQVIDFLDKNDLLIKETHKE